MSTELSTSAIVWCIYNSDRYVGDDSISQKARAELDALLATIAAMKCDVNFQQLQIKQGLDICNQHVGKIYALHNENVALREQLASAEQRMSEMIHKDEHELQMKTEAQRGYELCVAACDRNAYIDTEAIPKYSEAIAAQKAKE